MYQKVLVVYKNEEITYENVQSVYTTSPFLAIVMKNGNKYLLLNSDVSYVECIAEVKDGK